MQIYVIFLRHSRLRGKIKKNKKRYAVLLCKHMNKTAPETGILTPFFFDNSIFIKIILYYWFYIILWVLSDCPGSLKWRL